MLDKVQALDSPLVADLAAAVKARQEHLVEQEHLAKVALVEMVLFLQETPLEAEVKVAQVKMVRRAVQEEAALMITALGLQQLLLALLGFMLVAVVVALKEQVEQRLAALAAEARRATLLTALLAQQIPVAAVAVEVAALLRLEITVVATVVQVL